MTYGDPLLVVGGLLLAMAWIRQGHPTGIVPVSLVLGAGLLLAAGLIAILPSEAASSLLPTMRMTVTLAGVPLILMFAASTPARLHRVVDVWLFSVAISCLVGILDILGLTHIGASLTHDFVTFNNRAPGLTLHPNHLGALASMALPVALAVLTTGGARGLTALALIPVILGGIAVSASRGALLAAAGGIALFFIFRTSANPSRGRVVLLITLVASVAILFLTPAHQLTSQAGQRVAGDSGTVDSDAYRTSSYREAIDAGLANPVVGQGFQVARGAHSIYLQLLQAGGFLALAGFLAFATGVLQRARNLAIEIGSEQFWLASLLAGSAAGMGSWLIFGIVGNQLYDRYLYVPAGLVLAIGLVHRGSLRATEGVQARPQPSRLRHPATFVPVSQP